MKKILTFIILINLLTSCQSAKEALTLKKKSSADEFLIEKKNPLVLPPDYGDLPFPKDEKVLIEKNDIDEIKIIVSDDKNLSTSIEKNSQPTSIEKSILEKIEQQ